MVCVGVALFILNLTKIVSINTRNTRNAGKQQKADAKTEFLTQKETQNIGNSFCRTGLFMRQGVQDTNFIHNIYRAPIYIYKKGCQQAGA